MFKYSFNGGTKRLNITLPDALEFNFEFLKETSKMLFRINQFSFDEVVFLGKSNAKYDKLSKAYLFNLMANINERKRILWDRHLRLAIGTTVHYKKGEDYLPINDMVDKIASEELNIYRFYGDVGIEKPIEELTRIMVDMNLAIEPERVKEFLSTTIGEIFSNSTNHSKKQELFFMFDIVNIDGVFLLCVNIVDFGTTIVESVREFLLRTQKIHISGKDCIEWAIKSGNTTRNGAGGYGLPTLIEYIRTVNGELSIFSGNAYFELEKGNIEVQEMTEAFFNGTSVTFKVALFDTNSFLKYDPKEDRLISVSLDNI